MSTILSILQESRIFLAPESFSATAHIGDGERLAAMRLRAEEDPEGFWADQAQTFLSWSRPWDKVLEWEPPFAKWFVGGKLNASYNCIDRHLTSWKRNKAAIVWEGEPGDRRTLTYQELHYEVSKFANVLKGLGVTKGDRVAIYMPLIPEIVIAMQACARIGATHSVVFGGFSAEALRDRILDAGCRVVVTADGGFRRGKELPLKPAVDQALTEGTPVEHVVVYRRTKADISMTPGRDHDWNELMEAASAECPPLPLDSEHPLFILYTSGTTGRPKGVVHSTGGYLLGAAYSTHYVFDLKDNDLFWCTADAGWITGHTYLTYGPLANAATLMMYEGAPNYPTPDRMWEIIERHKVTIFYTAPTAIRAFIRWGEQHPKKHDLTSLRLLGTVGEPINPEAWMWYYHIIGRGECPIVDTWWQTETGSIIISPIPGVTATTPGTATRALPGYSVDVVSPKGESVGVNEGGLLVIKKPWPSMLRTIYGDPERYVKTYWSEIEGVYFTGDGARRDEAGNIWVMGRVDDVMNVSGHRLSTMEIESALVSHRSVAEAAVVGRPDELTGQAIVAFVTLQQHISPSPETIEELKAHVVKEIGALARPSEIRITDSLPKTRSGKIMRRLLRAIAGGEVSLGDTSTLEDRSVLEKLKARYEEEE